MESHYRDADANRALEAYGPEFGEDLALRVYTSRLLGREPSLVLHGGGNTSVKSKVVELLGDETEVLYVKGSGWDLASIEPTGFPACRLAHLRRCAERESMTDEEMVAQLRGQMIDPASPTPSVEALLHAYLPAKFVDHTHADAVLSVVDQPESASLVAELYGDDVLFVPYVMPGFVLARAVASLWSARPASSPPPSLMVLDKHGIFTWGESAKESYERMIDAVTRAERFVVEQTQRRIVDVAPPSRGPASERRTLAEPSAELTGRLGPLARGALCRVSGAKWVAAFRTGMRIASFTERRDLAEVSQIGCATPDHVIRTKPWPLLLPRFVDEPDDEVRAVIEERIEAYARRYDEYFQTGVTARSVSRTRLDPYPRVMLLPGVGALTFGKTFREASVVADIVEHTVRVIEATSACGAYQPVGPLDLFDVEYWSLEQAKLDKRATEGPLARRLALVTGAAGGIGRATAAAMLEAGAHVTLCDVDAAALEATRAELAIRFGDRVRAEACDVTSEPSVGRLVRGAAAHYGGLDIVVSNAGDARTGELHTSAGQRALEASFALNLMSHQFVARAAAKVFLAQGVGGVLLFNASKSAFNQGPEFGPYAVPKAALLSLMRQYAIDLAAHGVRANAINADRVRTNLFGGGMLESRAKARGLSVDSYFRANLLGRETTAEDVARAFVYLATADATTGCVLTVDGGNAAAFPR